MQKDVLVIVSGTLFGSTDDGEPEDIQVISPGEYFLKNNKHYVMYEERMEDFEEPTRNLLKITPDEISIRKRGLVNTEMVFQRKGTTSAHYTTPYGNLVLGIHARDMKVQEEEERIRVRVDYDLEINYEHVSRCSIQIQVQSQDGQIFSLTS